MKTYTPLHSFKAILVLIILSLTLGAGSVWGGTYTLGWGAASGSTGTYTNFTATSGSVSGIVSFSTAKNSSGSDPAYNSSDKELRLYYNNGGAGGSITLTPASGKYITGFVMTTSTSPSVNYSVDGGSATSVSVSSNTYTVSGISAYSSITIQNVNTSNTQLRITTIQITYATSSPKSITWSVNGENWNTGHGSPSTSVYLGSKVTSLPTAPTSSNCDNSKVFVGWSATAIDGTTDTRPNDLFTTAAEAPTVTGAVTYYAVFATAGEGDVAITFNFDGTTLGTGGYKDTDFEWKGIDFKRSQMYYNDSGAQIKASNNGFWNTEAFPGAIKEVKVTATQNAATLYTGTSAKATTSNNSISTGAERTFSINTANNYRYLYIKSGSSYTVITTLKVTYVGTTYSAYATTCCTQLGTINGPVNMSSSTDGTVTISDWMYGDSTNVSSYTVRLYKLTATPSTWTIVSGEAANGDSGAAGTRTGIAKNSKSVTYSGLEYGETYKFTVQAIGDGSTYCSGNETAVTSINGNALTDNKFRNQYSIYIDEHDNSNYSHHWISSLSSHAGNVAVNLEAFKNGTSDGTYYQYKLSLGGVVWWGNTGTMTSSNCSNWSFSTGSSNCKLQTAMGGDYTFAINTTSGEGYPKVSVTFAVANQESGKHIYFDNSVLQWTTLRYRIGNNSHNQNQTPTLVPGTDNFYETTTPTYNDMEAWHFANNPGWADSHTIYRTATNNESGQPEIAITASTVFQQYRVTGDITVIPTSTHSTGTDNDGDKVNNQCEFYTINTPTDGMLTHTATITAPTGGTITIAYTDVNNTAQSKTTTTAGLAHRTILTITASANTGYELSSLTVNGSAFTSGSTHILDDDATIAATFTAAAATITLNNYTGSATTTGYHYGDSFTLPSTNSYNCNDKTFVGWSTVTVASTNTKPASNFYEPGASVTLGTTNTFYAVFAEVETVVDTLYYSKIGVTEISYADWSDKTSASDAVYKGQSAGAHTSIQMRSNNNNSGIVTTASGGKIRKVKVVWNSNTTSGRTLDIYGANTAYTAASQLYSTPKGEKLGSIVYGTSTELTSTTDSTFIGLRSHENAMYIDTIYITWGNTSDYSTSCAACKTVTVTYTAAPTGGTVGVKKSGSSVATGTAINACSAQTLTVTLTPAAHYTADGLVLGGTATSVTQTHVGNVYTVSIPAQASDGTLTLTPTFTAETPLTITLNTNGNGTAGSIGTIYSGDNFNLPTVTGYDSECVDFIGWVDATSGSTFTGAGTTTTELAGLIEAGTNSGTLTTNKTYTAVFGERDVSSVEGYVEVTSAPTDWSGTYLIVYKTGGVVFDGSLNTLDAAYDTIKTTITSTGIVGTTKLNNATFTITKSGETYTIQSASGVYIGRTNNSKNGMDESTTTASANSISMAEGSNQVVIAGTGGYTLRYNSNSDQSRFRYYGSSQQAIHLYKTGYVESVAYTYATDPNCGTKYMVKVHGEDVASKNVTGGNVKYNGGTRKKFEEDATVTIAATAATGYTFTGWTVTKLNDASDVTSTLLSTNSTTASTSFTMPAYEVNIAATFTQNNYTVTVTAPSNGSITAPTNGATKHYGDEVTVTLSPNTGYEVTSVKYNDGSDHAITLTNNSGSFTMPDADVTISATIALATYTLSYDLDDGSVATPNPSSYQYTSAAITLTNPTKEGYTFTGWSGTGLTGDNNMTVTIPANSTGDRSYTAHWQIKTYTVTWLVDGEAYTTGSPTTVVNHGSKVTALPTAPEDDALGSCANSFVGWSTTQVGSSPYAGNISTLGLFTTTDGSPTITTNTTFYAVFGNAQ